MAVLDRIDKNGTKYYIEEKCPKCGGQGIIDGYRFVQNGICFKCGGSGISPYGYKVYTPEYQKKLNERKIAKQKLKAPLENKKFFKKHGLNNEGTAWIVIGNTYDIKDELKENGAKYNNIYGWHFDYENITYQTHKIEINQVAYKNQIDQYVFLEDAILVIKEIRKSYIEVRETNYIGTVGERITLNLRLSHSSSFESEFGTTYFHIFLNENNDIIVWKTGTSLEPNLDYIIKGTIKEHSMYNGSKQTYITRCKVID